MKPQIGNNGGGGDGNYLVIFSDLVHEINLKPSIFLPVTET